MRELVLTVGGFMLGTKDATFIIETSMITKTNSNVKKHRL